MLGVAVRGIGAGRDIALLRAGWHAGRRPGALDIEKNRRNFSKISQSDELLHQGNAGAGRRRKRARAVPAGADHDADRGEFVLGLDDRVFGLFGVRIDAQLGAMSGEGVRERGRWRDRIPSADGRATINRAERGGRVALDEDPVADGSGALELDAERALQIEDRVVAADVQRLDIRLDQLVLALVLFANELLDDLHIHVEQGGEHADIDDVLEQLALARIGVFAIADRGQRHTDDRDVIAEFRRRQRLG